MGIQKRGTVNSGEERGTGDAMGSSGKPLPVRPVEVAAGLIFREGRLLIAQRYPGDGATGFAAGELRGAFIVDWPAPAAD